MVLGEPVSWDDLAERGGNDRDAVRELTARIDRGLRSVTLNLERWEDRPLVETAEAIWSLEVERAEGPADQLRRYEITARILAAVRRGSDTRWKAVQLDLSRHYRRLALFGFQPADLQADVGTPVERALVGATPLPSGYPAGRRGPGGARHVSGPVLAHTPFDGESPARPRPGVHIQAPIRNRYVHSVGGGRCLRRCLGLGLGLGSGPARAAAAAGDRGPLDSRAVALGIQRRAPVHDPSYTQRRHGGAACRTEASGVGVGGPLRGVDAGLVQ